MFLLVFVILFKGGVGFPACITGHMTSIQGGLPMGGLHPGGLGRPPGTRKAGGTHITGMLSCYYFFFPFWDPGNHHRWLHLCHINGNILETTFRKSEELPLATVLIGCNNVHQPDTNSFPYCRISKCCPLLSISLRKQRMHSSSMRIVCWSGRLRGRCLPREGVYTPPWTELLTHAFVNIILLQLLLRTVIKHWHNGYVSWTSVVKIKVPLIDF